MPKRTVADSGKQRREGKIRSAGKATAEGALAPYAAKRNFTATPEPQAKAVPADGDRFCVQKHDARRLHYDLRLELDGVLKSWAVTRGPSLVPTDKRLAVHTEDHPLEYLTFEGVIPKGEYGGGTMIVWDQGRWRPLADPHKGYAKGHLEFELTGERLKGRWHLVRMRPRPREKKEQWLLIKGDDDFARVAGAPEITEEASTSVISGQTNEELARSGDIRSDHAARRETARDGAKPQARLSAVAGARKGLLPVFVEPSLAALTGRAPRGKDWIHEIKFDGYRLQARLDGGSIKLLTRKGLDWTAKFTPVARALKDLRIGSALIDGELVVENASGVSTFSGLQSDLKEGRTDRMVYYAFDLLYLDGYDLTGTPLIERKLLLAGLLDDAPADGVVRFSAHLETDGEAMLRHAGRLGLEGIVSKRKDKPYIAGRGPHWLKRKCSFSQEFVIAGFVPSTASRRAVGSLVLGVYEKDRLVHVGRVGTGFTEAVAHALFTELDRLRRPQPAFAAPLDREAARGVRFVEPKLVAEVELRAWTADGLLRHSSFKGLRDDKDPKEVTREGMGSGTSAVSLRPTDFHLTHPDRIYFPDVGLTKRGLADFYEEIAGFILPHIVGRPLSLFRCPSGIDSACFYQKRGWQGMDKTIRRKQIAGEEVLFIEDLEGLVGLVQSGVLEIHPWGSTIAHPEKPDRITFDLDPAEDVTWTALIEAALEIRERLGAIGLESFVKTTGGKGLHVVVPLTPRADWDAVKTFAQELAEGTAKDAPDRFVATMAKRDRTGRIFIDYLRNTRGATAVGAYSTRARPGAPVSTPLGFEELSPTIRPNHFTVDNLPTRLKHLKADPWSRIAEIDQALPSVRRPRRTKA
jgi:bifunctional non-homologous end joining protein LigD